MAALFLVQMLGKLIITLKTLARSKVFYPVRASLTHNP